MLKKEKKKGKVFLIEDSRKCSVEMISPFHTCILLVLCVVKVAKNTVYRSEEIYADQEYMTQSKSS